MSPPGPAGAVGATLRLFIRSAFGHPHSATRPDPLWLASLINVLRLFLCEIQLLYMQNQSDCGKGGGCGLGGRVPARPLHHVPRSGPWWPRLHPLAPASSALPTTPHLRPGPVQHNLKFVDIFLLSFLLLSLCILSSCWSRW
jgi:hypothetical protein